MARKSLKDEEIEYLLNLDDSEISDFNDSDEGEFEAIDVSKSTRSTELVDAVIANLNYEDDVVENEEHDVEEDVHHDDVLSALVNEDNVDLIEYLVTYDLGDNQIIDQIEDIEFEDNTNEFETTEKKFIKYTRDPFVKKVFEFLPSDVENFEFNTIVKTPIRYFENYLPSELFSTMERCTNFYASGSAPNFRPTNAIELAQMMGIHILMGTLKLPRVIDYWNKYLKIETISSVMTRNRFHELRTNLHLVMCQKNDKHPIGDSSISNESDKFWRVRPLINSIQARCNKMPVEEVVSVDEQIIPFTGKLSIKQYIKGEFLAFFSKF